MIFFILLVITLLPESRGERVGGLVSVVSSPVLNQTSVRAVRVPRAQTIAARRKPRGILLEDIAVHLILLFVLATVLFPIVWIVSMAIDPRNISSGVLFSP
ncbi:MAG: hypothetical protein R2839_02415 [Thermomicrobiales bacterium]